MKILLSGSSGLIGKTLLAHLKEGGHEVTRLVRLESKNPQAEILWDPEEGSLDAGALEDMDGVIHLAGENVAQGRWTQAKKDRIRQSRVKGTQYLSAALAGLSRPPKVLICASAIGYYGDRGEEVLKEESKPGVNFLSETCKDWEAATQRAKDSGIRVVNLRIGVVLSPKGGALKKMLTPFKLAAGGIVGTGSQYWSWISLDDMIQIIMYVLKNDRIVGPVNAVSPQPVTNLQFTKTLGKVLKRPTILPLPSFMARTLMGSMADELLLASCRVKPARLMAEGYAFVHPDLESTLHQILQK